MGKIFSFSKGVTPLANFLDEQIGYAYTIEEIAKKFCRILKTNGAIVNFYQNVINIDKYYEFSKMEMFIGEGCRYSNNYG